MANAEPKPAPEREELDIVLGVLQDDIRHVHVRITAAIGIAAVFVTQIDLDVLRREPDRQRYATFAGIVALFLSAALFFYYTQQLNKLRLRIAADAVVGSATALEAWRAKIVKHPVRTPQLWVLRGGQLLLILGVVCVSFVLYDLIVDGGPAPVHRPHG